MNDAIPARSLADLARGMSRVALVVVAVLGLALAVFDALVLASQMGNRQQQLSELAIDAGVRELDSYMHSMEDASRQIASRTQIRMELERYADGEVTLESLAAFTAPRLMDGFQADPDLVFLHRTTAGGRTVAELGELNQGVRGVLQETIARLGPTAQETVVRLLPSGSRVDGDYVAARTIMRDDTGRVLGYDVSVFAAGELRSVLRSSIQRFQRAEILVTTTHDSWLDAPIMTVGVRSGEEQHIAAGYDVLEHALPQWQLQLSLLVDPAEFRRPLIITVLALALVLLAAVLITLGITHRIMGSYSRQIEDADLSMTRALQLKTHSLEMQLMRSTEMEAQLNESLVYQRHLVQELHHRVKNNLAVVIGMVNLELDSTLDPREAMQDLRTRIYAIAAVHEQLYAEDRVHQVNVSEYLHDLATEAVGMVGSQDVDFEYNGVDENIHIERAVPLGLIFSELLINSFKHGGSSSLGKIVISLTREGDSLVLAYSDDAPPYPEDLDESSSLGMRLIKGLTQQIQGDIRFPAPGRSSADGLKTVLLRFKVNG